MEPDNFSFEKFSQNPFYFEINSRLVNMVDVAPGHRVVDLACGTGSVTQLVLERIRGARDSAIIAIDQSAVSLKQAMDNLKDVRDAAVQFVQSRVEPLSEVVKESVDAIFFCNAIHYVQDKDALVSEVSKTLKIGGRFAFNTSFYEGGQPPGSETFYRKWMLKAARILRREYGLKRDPSSRVESRKQLTVENYRQLLLGHNLEVIKQEVDLVKVPLEGWLDISQFEDFISGVMPGVPLEKASAALQKGAAETYKEMDIEYVHRNWLDMVSVKI